MTIDGFLAGQVEFDSSWEYVKKALGISGCKSHFNIPNKFLIGLVLALTVVSGCRPNHRYATKGNIKITALYFDGQPIYRNLQIGVGGRPFYANLEQYGEVSLELGTGNFVKLRDLTVDLLKAKSSIIEDVSKPGHGRWSSGERIKMGSRLIFCVDNNQILELYVNAVGLEGDEGQKFRTADDKEIAAMPFTHEELQSLFGEPDVINDVWHQ